MMKNTFKRALSVFLVVLMLFSFTSVISLAATCPEGDHDYSILCTDEQSHWYKCTKCGAESEHVAHTLEALAAVPATCSSTGLTEGSRCTECKSTVIVQTVTPKTAHTDADANNICDVCGADLTPSKDDTISSIGEFLIKLVEFMGKFKKIFDILKILKIFI